jgi:hypothetical protein
MALEDPAKKSRDKLLDDLKQAHDDYYKKELKRIDAEEGFYRSVLKARGGASTLAKANASASKILLANDIGSFLTG